MISSIPRFPAEASKKKYSFSDEQKRFGQIVLCVTVYQKDQQKIGNDMFLIETFLFVFLNILLNTINLFFRKHISYNKSLHI